MNYGDEFVARVASDFDPGQATRGELNRLFQHSPCIARFSSSADGSFTHDLTNAGFEGLLAYRLNSDCLIEINDSFLRNPIAIRNEVADVISFQFVSRVKRSEFLGGKKHIHDLGPAIIVTAIPRPEITYRLPKINETIRHVVLHTTLSNLLPRMGEAVGDYPDWIQEILAGKFRKPRQRVLFLEDIHRDLIWPCFNLPVSGSLLDHWLSAKFHELLSIGLQILKNNQLSTTSQPMDFAFPDSNKIRHARTILNLEYAHPPTLPKLAHQLGISETQLKTNFKSMFGTTVLQYCIHKRVEAAKILLDEERHSISEIADIVGYEDHSAFSRAFRRLSGRSPQQWRQSKRL
jgi:AraC-like DNA-binding protein